MKKVFADMATPKAQIKARISSAIRSKKKLWHNTVALLVLCVLVMSFGMLAACGITRK